jgi:hypothetical protein
MNELQLAALLVALGLIGAVIAWQWVAYAIRSRANTRRAHGYEFIHALRAYSAWTEFQRDLPFTGRSLDELTSPGPLTRARELKRLWFPELSERMVRLLQAHSRMIEYFWEQDLLRLSQGSAWRPAYEDAQYQQLRGAQEDLIDEMIGICRDAIGEGSLPWQSTGSDFAFSSTLKPRGPAGQG